MNKNRIRIKTYRWKLFVLLTLFVLYLPFIITTAATRYVSHTGSSTPPYTSWETAADSIMSAINVSFPGDTIYVANGVYEEQVTMIPGLTLIGSGMDSCVIDTRNLEQTILFTSIRVLDSCKFQGFNVVVSNDRNSRAIISDTATAMIEFNKLQDAHTSISLRQSNSMVQNNIIQNFEEGISLINSESLIKNNQLIDVHWGISIDALFTDNYYPVVEYNVISCDGFGVIVQVNSRPTIRNNIILLNGDGANGYAGGGSDTAWVYNNLIISEGDHNFTRGLANSIRPTYSINNFLVGNFTDFGIYSVDYNVIKNNNIINSNRGVVKEDGHNPVIQYNNSWNNVINYSGFTPDSTNISVDPMVVSEDSLDFHLQMYSPLIDTGDPSILDKDSSRSDIGLYGGTYGETYKYLDLAPRPPVNLTAVVDTNRARISWNRNTESDFSNYKIYRDTVSGFIIDSTKLISVQRDSFFLQVISPDTKSLYFKLTATDNRGNESAPSEELAVIITSVKDNNPMSINDYYLYQNYPNPFNPVTKIGYRLKESGYVKLYVYDIKGELVSVLVNQNQEAGYHEVEFAASVRHPVSGIPQLASGIYIYQLMIKNEKNVPVFTDMKKMVYLK